MIFCINTTSDISKLLYVISRAVRRVNFETILKYREWYLWQISRTNHAIISFVHISSFTRSLALKQRLAATRKWPNIMCTCVDRYCCKRTCSPIGNAQKWGIAEKSYTYILTSFTSVERSFFVHTFVQHILQMVGKVRQTFVEWKQYLTYSMRRLRLAYY